MLSRSLQQHGPGLKGQSASAAAGGGALATPPSIRTSHRRSAGPALASSSAGAGSTSTNLSAGTVARRASRPDARGRRQTVAASAQARGRGGKGSGGTDDEPDWEAEMSIFKQRISRPNQLATLRELEAQVSMGKVLYARDGLAIVSGLNADAPLGTKMSFATGTAGVLLWHRSDNLSFALVLGDPSTVVEGTPVECKIKGVLQVVDDAQGPITRKDYEVFQVPTGDDMFGRVHDHIGRHLAEYDSLTQQGSGTAAASSSGTAAQGSGSRSRPLLNQQVEMKDREQICESLLTGVKGLDILTPLGRGQSLLVIGPGGAGKSALALDALRGQAAWGAGGSGAGAGAEAAAVGSSRGSVPAPPGGAVRSVLALVGRPKAEVQDTLSALSAAGCLANTAVVFAEEGAPLGHQFAAMCTACSIGERVRDEGGHSLVAVDDIKPLSDAWEQLLSGLAGLGPELLCEGLIKDERGRDLKGPAPDAASTSAPADLGDGASAAAASASAPAPAAPGGDGHEDPDALVEYQGMLVSGAVAQRRGFLSTFFMRAAKVARAKGGGSMSLLPLVPGTCATGVSKRIDLSKYKTLSPEQIAKLEAALRAKQLAEELAAGAGSGELATEVVEEFISIADGQAVLDAAVGRGGQPGGPAYAVNPKLSVTRIGTRAYYKALEALAPQVRLDLAQADDARRFGATASAASGSSLTSTDIAAPPEARAAARARLLAAALLQAPGEPVPLAEQVVTLFAVQRGFADRVEPEQVAPWLRGAMAHVRSAAPGAMQEVGRTGLLTAEAEASITNALRTFVYVPAPAAA